MSVVIRLQNLPWSATTADIGRFFRDYDVPDGNIHIVDGDAEEAYICFCSEQEARRAMQMDGCRIKDSRVRLQLCSRNEMQTSLVRGLSRDTSSRGSQRGRNMPHLRDRFRPNRDQADEPSRNRSPNASSYGRSPDRSRAKQPERAHRSFDTSDDRRLQGDRDSDFEMRSPDRRHHRSRSPVQYPIQYSQASVTRQFAPPRSKDNENKNRIREMTAYEDTEDQPKNNDENQVLQQGNDSSLSRPTEPGGNFGDSTALYDRRSPAAGQDVPATVPEHTQQDQSAEDLDIFARYIANRLQQEKSNKAKSSEIGENFSNVTTDKWARCEPIAQPTQDSSYFSMPTENFYEQPTTEAQSMYQWEHSNVNQQAYNSSRYEMDYSQPMSMDSNYASYGETKKNFNEYEMSSHYAGLNTYQQESSVSQESEPLCLEISGLPKRANYREIHSICKGVFVPRTNVKWRTGRRGGKSCAYVKMNNKTDFRNILKATNVEIDGHAVQINKCPLNMYMMLFGSNDSEQSTDWKRDPDDLWYMLKGLPYETTENKVADLFHGIRISDMIILYNEHGKATGTGFVQFTNVEDYKTAFQRNGNKIGRRYIELLESTAAEAEMARKKDLAQDSDGQKAPTNISLDSFKFYQYVPPPYRPLCALLVGLPFDISDHQIFDFFGDYYGRPSAVHLVFNNDVTASGRAFAEFLKSSDFDLAIGKNGSYIDQHRIAVKQVLYEEMLNTFNNRPVQHQYGMSKKRVEANVEEPGLILPEKVPYLWEPPDEDDYPSDDQGMFKQSTFPSMMTENRSYGFTNNASRSNNKRSPDDSERYLNNTQRRQRRRALQFQERQRKMQEQNQNDMYASLSSMTESSSGCSMDISGGPAKGGNNSDWNNQIDVSNTMSSKGFDHPNIRTQSSYESADSYFGESNRQPRAIQNYSSSQSNVQSSTGSFDHRYTGQSFQSTDGYFEDGKRNPYSYQSHDSNASNIQSNSSTYDQGARGQPVYDDKVAENFRSNNNFNNATSITRDNNKKKDARQNNINIQLNKNSSFVSTPTAVPHPAKDPPAKLQGVMVTGNRPALPVPSSKALDKQSPGKNEPEFKMPLPPTITTSKSNVNSTNVKPAHQNLKPPQGSDAKSSTQTPKPQQPFLTKPATQAPKPQEPVSAMQVTPAPKPQQHVVAAKPVCQTPKLEQPVAAKPLTQTAQPQQPVAAKPLTQTAQPQQPVAAKPVTQNPKMPQPVIGQLVNQSQKPQQVVNSNPAIQQASQNLKPQHAADSQPATQQSSQNQKPQQAAGSKLASQLPSHRPKPEQASDSRPATQQASQNLKPQQPADSKPASQQANQNPKPQQAADSKPATQQASQNQKSQQAGGSEPATSQASPKHQQAADTKSSSQSSNVQQAKVGGPTPNPQQDSKGSKKAASGSKNYPARHESKFQPKKNKNASQGSNNQQQASPKGRQVRGSDKGRSRNRFGNDSSYGNKSRVENAGNPSVLYSKSGSSNSPFENQVFTVQMSNVHPSAGLGDILQFFRGFNISDNDVIQRYNDYGQPTGDLRISFSSYMEAEAAVHQLSYRPLLGVPVEIFWV